MNKFVVFFLISLGWQCSFATVSIDSICYKQVNSGSPRQAILKFRTYFDDDATQYIGGLVSYSQSKSAIALVFLSEESNEVAGLNLSEYRRSWLEVVDGKITGRYLEKGADAGNQFGKSIEYRNYRNKKTTLFSFSADDCE